jgi:hypothetical protein
MAVTAIPSGLPVKTLAGLRQKIEGKSADSCFSGNQLRPDNTAPDQCRMRWDSCKSTRNVCTMGLERRSNDSISDVEQFPTLSQMNFGGPP